MKKKGQVTMFVIFAIIIVVLAVLIAYFYPQIRFSLGGQTVTPSSYLQSCIEEDLNLAIEKVALQGGSLNPEHYLFYENEKIAYLCYTNEYYKTCVMQQPLLKRYTETEISKAISTRADECFSELEKAYQRSGYEVSIVRGKPSIELLPKRVTLDFNSTVTIQKENSQRYTDVKVSVMNNIYELVSIATSILNFETSYGDSETTIYMNYYRDLKVEKIKQSEGSKVYILTDRNNKNKFQFATRSLAWPPGV